MRMEDIRSLVVLLTIASASTARADGDVHKVQHVLILMQENHSFDNYFGALPYAPGSPYRAAAGPCRESDHSCVDGLSCRRDASGELRCANHNPDLGGAAVRAFHLRNRCVQPDLDHSWVGTHREMNYSAPNETLEKVALILVPTDKTTAMMAAAMPAAMRIKERVKETITLR